jgi:hypothetical protein
MPLHPSPTIAANLILVTQVITRSDTSHIGVLTYACRNNGPLSAQNCANAFQTAFNGRFATNFDTECTIQKPTIKLGDGTNVPLEAVAAGAAPAGSNTDPVPPSQVALLLKKNTGFSGKKNRGRTYFPWFVSSLNVNETGTVSAGEVTAIQTLANGFVADLNAASIPMCIANKTLSIPTPPLRPFVTAILLGHDVTTYTVENLVATQRRRLRG